MQLQPKRPPGRVDRKAAAYVLEIVQLRSAGYTYEAIREAVADVGIELSTSALRREVRRHRARPVAAVPVAASTPRPIAPTLAPVTPPTLSPPIASRSTPNGPHGLDLAEAFFATHTGNLLVHSKEIS